MRKKILPVSITSLCCSALLAACGGTDLGDPTTLAQSSSALQAGFPQPPPITVRPKLPLADGSYYFRGLGNRCWDFGGQAYWAVGAPVTLYGCNGSIAQQVRVKELDFTTHDVELRVQDLYCIGAQRSRVSPGIGLELQTCDGSPAQRFALDGDSVLMGSQASGAVTRQWVIEPRGDVTNLKTQLVVGTRETSDAEYFRYLAVDGSATKPHHGFRTVSSEADLDSALTTGWGTVIEVDPKAPLIVTGALPKEIHAGVTVRGYRKLLDQGPLIQAPNFPTDSVPVFEARETAVRVTGLRMEGPTRSTDSTPTPYQHGVRIIEGNDVIVDHIDGSGFTGAVVEITKDPVDVIDQTCPVDPPAYPRTVHGQSLNNFFHHNEREGGGYGTAVSKGAFALIQGNVSYMNRHSVTADGIQTTGYSAFDNFVLSDAPSYKIFGWDHEQDFDKHGTLDPGHWVGGVSDDYVQFGWNTFLGTNRHNIKERGTPCRFTSVHDSVFLQDEGSAISSDTEDEGKLSKYGNVFDVADPTYNLAVGDFDGDGIDDAFVGTGSGWWFSSGGRAEWRFLSRKKEQANALRFGDFDGDGRTDVVALHGTSVDVSWAGITPWIQLTTVPSGTSISALAVGDFDGDHNADLFLANGREWLFAPTGRVWQHFAFSSFQTWNLRFGDFDADGKTDVFGVTGGQYQYVPGGQSSWIPLRTALTGDVNGIVVADMDGDGYADLLRQVGNDWQYAARGWGGFVTLRTAPSGENINPAQVGRFDGDRKADVILWHDLHLFMSAGAANPTVLISRQDLR